jgi:hypothetical protein
MPRGGKREGAGRKRGSQNRRSRETVAVAEAAGALPLEFMLEIMRDPNEPIDRRLRMAIAAAPYCHAKLAAVEYKEPAFEIEELTDEELESVMSICDRLAKKLD